MLPTSVSGNVTLRFCLKVPGQVENDMILGTLSYRNGYNAAVFRPKTDAGLGWLKAEGDPQVVPDLLPGPARGGADRRAGHGCCAARRGR